MFFLGNSLSNSDIVFDWNEKDEFVNVSLLVGGHHNKANVNVLSEPQFLKVSFSDGRKFSTKLYEKIQEDCTEISFKGPRCVVKLLKYNPDIHWKSLEVRVV